MLAVYSFAWGSFSSVSLSAIEQQVIYQTANFENECDYCVPWHILLSQKAGMNKEHIEALRNGSDLNDKKLNALSSFTRQIIQNKGKIVQSQLDEFYNAGYDSKSALAVVLGIAIKTLILIKYF